MSVYLFHYFIAFYPDSEADDAEEVEGGCREEHCLQRGDNH